MSFKHSIFAVIVSVLAVSCLNSSHELQATTDLYPNELPDFYYAYKFSEELDKPDMIKIVEVKFPYIFL